MMCLESKCQKSTQFLYLLLRWQLYFLTTKLTHIPKFRMTLFLRLQLIIQFLYLLLQQPNFFLIFLTILTLRSIITNIFSTFLPILLCRFTHYSFLFTFILYLFTYLFCTFWINIYRCNTLYFLLC